MAITNQSLLASEPHFDPQEFDDAIAAHGTPVNWRRGVMCPCFNAQTGHAEVDCPFCEHGLGVLWDAGTPLTVLAPGRQRGDNYDATGMWMNGMIVLSFPSDTPPGHLDMIDLLAAEMVVNRELHVRGDANKLGQSTERLRFRQVLSVERIVALVSNAVRIYTAPDDFTVGADASIVWTDGLHGPPPDLQYSVRYLAHPSYLVVSPQSRDEASNRLPFRVMAQRLDFFTIPAVGEVTP